MTRATLAKVLVALLGTPPSGVTDDAITALCTRVDRKIDSITYPDTLSTTDEIACEIAVDMVQLEIEYGLWLQAGGALSGKPKPTVMPTSIMDRIERMITGTNDFSAEDMIGSG